MMRSIDIDNSVVDKDVELFKDVDSFEINDSANPSNSEETATKADYIMVKIFNPEKIGDGMSAYVVYTIKTLTNMSSFQKSTACVQRRFSDFISLYENLREKYLPQGVIIPYPPEKNVFGTAKMRISKSSSTDSEFIEKRRIELESFLSRITAHPILRQDDQIREFLELDGELPKRTVNQVLPRTMAKRLLKNVGDVVGKWTFRMEEVDDYFELKEEELENWDIQGDRLFSALNNLASDQHELAVATQTLSKTISVLANVEEHTGLARALGQLADTEEQISHFYSVQADAESTFLTDYAKSILNMVQACRETLAERVKIFKMLKDYESNLRNKREQKVRIEMSPKSDRAKIPSLEKEIGDLLHHVEETESDFEVISAAIKKEIQFVDETRFEEFKAAALCFLNTMLQVQENILKTWEAFIGHAKAIE